MKQEYSGKDTLNTEAFLVECLAWGLLRAHGIKNPPVPVREMITNPLPIFEGLSLLELNLGLYDATYKPCLNGSRLIVVDTAKPPNIQRAGIARALYMAFCHSPRAAELHWPSYEQSHANSEIFSRCLLMPADWVRAACTEAISVEGLAIRFGTPVRMVKQRLSEMVNHCSPTAFGEPLARIMFSLEEPWQGRFLELVANMATSQTGMNQTMAKQRPTKKEVVAWLNSSPSLYQDTRYLLDAWRRPWNVHLATSLVQGTPA